MYHKWCHELDKGRIPDGLQEMLKEYSQEQKLIGGKGGFVIICYFRAGITNQGTIWQMKLTRCVMKFQCFQTNQIIAKPLTFYQNVNF